MVTRSVIVLFFCILFTGCGEDYPFETQDLEPKIPPNSLIASRFPTADRCYWNYVSLSEDHSYVMEIAGAKNILGYPAKILKNDSIVPIDQLSSLYGYPIITSFFTKDMDSYTEHAYELKPWFIEGSYVQKNYPKRVLWSFPLYEGKEWQVWKSLIPPEVTFTRKVVSVGNVLSVPAGAFRDVYYVEEYSSIPTLPEIQEIPNRYWIAPDIGIIKYQYLDLRSGETRTYELKEFEIRNN